MTETILPKLKPEVTIDKFDSSMVEDSYLLSCGSRQWQVSEMVYRILIHINGQNDVEEICREVNREGGQHIEPESVHYILHELLWKKGVLEGSENMEPKKNSMNQNLWLRVTLLKGSLVEKFSFLSVLYNRKIFIYLASIGLASQIWLLSFMLHASTYRTVLNTDGKGFIYLLAVGILVTFFHELGHATAAMHYGIKPGNIGFGIYYVMPVFYSDVTKVWKLSRPQRVIVDIGGIYFHSLVLLLIYGLGLFFSNSSLTICAILLSMETVLNLNPFIKLDGYWILSDLTGIPNLQEQMMHFLRSKFKKLFRMEDEAPFSLAIGKKEKKFFYVYVLFSSLFLIFFFYWIFSMVYGVLTNLDRLKAIFVVDTGNQPVWNAVVLVARNISNNIIYLISLFFVGRILYSFGKKLVLGGLSLIQRRMRREKSDRGVSENA